ncbi:MAG: PQQ-binding-like beta-propeller repeat protein [Pseudomonadota bacterium]
MKSLPARLALLAFVPLAFAPLACAPADLGRAGNPDAVAAAMRRSDAPAAKPVNQAGRPLVYLALGGPKGARLGAFDLAQSRLLWEVPARLTGRAVAGASIVVHADGSALVARDVTSGAPRWRTEIADGQTLVGYAVDGDAVYFVARRGNELRGGEAELVALAGGSGGVRWRRALGTANVGGPAVRGGVVAVPNRSQFVSLIDGENGAPLAQALSKEQAANFVEATPEGMFYGYGADGAYLLSSETAVGVRSSPGFLRAKLPAFVRPVYHFDMYKPELMNHSAIDRNRLLWRAQVAGPRARFAGDSVCVLNYRFFFGFDATSGDLRWAYSHPLVEAASAAHTGAAIVFVTADGELGALDPRTGRLTYRFRLPGGDVVTGATFDAEGHAPVGGDVPEGPSLSGALSAIVWDPDRRFAEVKIFALDELARLPGRDVTADLLKVLSKADLPPSVVKRAASALVERKDTSAAPLFVDAIRVHSDYATGVTSANLDVLARAAGALRAREAAAPLAEHLRLPETEPAAVLEIARALVAMGADETLPALRDYLAMYRADPIYEGNPAPLLAVADALVKLGGAREREWLLYVSEEPRSLAALREYARHALAQTAAGAASSPSKAGAEPTPPR